MTDQNDTVETAYGRLDRKALLEVEQSYDTHDLLTAVDQISALSVALTGPDGLRDSLLELHCMAHSVINGAGLSVPTDGDTLPELAALVIFEINTAISTLQRIAQQVGPLEGLQARN